MGVFKFLGIQETHRIHGMHGSVSAIKTFGYWKYSIKFVEIRPICDSCNSCNNDWDFLFDSMLYVELTLESLGCDCLGAGNNSLELSEAMTLTTLYKTHPPPLRANFLVLLIILHCSN